MWELELLAMLNETTSRRMWHRVVWSLWTLCLNLKQYRFLFDPVFLRLSFPYVHIYRLMLFPSSLTSFIYFCFLLSLSSLFFYHILPLDVLSFLFLLSVFPSHFILYPFPFSIFCPSVYPDLLISFSFFLFIFSFFLYYRVSCTTFFF